MNCTRCGAPLEDRAQFCSQCGAPAAAGGGTPLPTGTLPLPTSVLTSAPQLTMRLESRLTAANFRFEDPSGQVVGETQGEHVFPLKYTLFDSAGNLVLVLDAVRVRGLLYEFQVHDATGAVLASVHQQSSVMSRKYEVSVNGQPRMQLTSDAVGFHYELTENGSGRVLASGERHAGLRDSSVNLSFTPDATWDHRIGLGVMILVYYLSTRRVG